MRVMTSSIVVSHENASLFRGWFFHCPEAGFEPGCSERAGSLIPHQNGRITILFKRDRGKPKTLLAVYAEYTLVIQSGAKLIRSQHLQLVEWSCYLFFGLLHSLCVGIDNHYSVFSKIELE